MHTQRTQPGGLRLWTLSGVACLGLTLATPTLAQRDPAQPPDTQQPASPTTPLETQPDTQPARPRDMRPGEGTDQSGRPGNYDRQETQRRGGLGANQRMGRMRRGMAAITANGDYVYVYRHGTLYQLRSADLSLAMQKALPLSGAQGGVTRFYRHESGSDTEEEAQETPDTSSDNEARSGNENRLNQNDSDQPADDSSDRDQETDGNTPSNESMHNETSPDNGVDQPSGNVPSDTAGEALPSNSDDAANSDAQAQNDRMSSSFDDSRDGIVSMAAGGDYIYLLQGDTLYQVRTSDLSLVAQKTLPAPSTVETPGNTDNSTNKNGATGSGTNNGAENEEQTSPDMDSDRSGQMPDRQPDSEDSESHSSDDGSQNGTDQSDSSGTTSPIPGSDKDGAAGGSSDESD